MRVRTCVACIMVSGVDTNTEGGAISCTLMLISIRVGVCPKTQPVRMHPGVHAGGKLCAFGHSCYVHTHSTNADPNNNSQYVFGQALLCFWVVAVVAMHAQRCVLRVWIGSSTHGDQAHAKQMRARLGWEMVLTSKCTPSAWPAHACHCVQSSR